MSVPASACLTACSLAPVSAPTGTPFRPAAVQHELRRHAEGVHDELDRMLEGGIEHHGRPFRAQVIAEVVAEVAIPEALRIDTVLRQDGLHMDLVRRRNARLDLLGCQRLFLAVEAGRNEQVDAIGLAVDVFVEPGQFDVERLRRVAHGAEHTESARALLTAAITSRQ